MPVNPALAVTVPAGLSLYRITAVSFHTTDAVHHKQFAERLVQTCRQLRQQAGCYVRLSAPLLPLHPQTEHQPHWR